MNAEMQAQKEVVPNRPKFVVGMDAHSRKLAISIWEWSDVWNPVLHKEIKSCEINAVEATYERLVPIDSITIIEASTNSVMLKERLNELGFRAEVVRADLLIGTERKRKICDIQDARNLAKAYMKGNVKEFVWTPSNKYADYRDIHFAYRDAMKELTRISNRIWSLCSRRGLDLPIRSESTKTTQIAKMISKTNITGFLKERLTLLISDYDYMLKRKSALEKIMVKIVLQEEQMLKLMQLPGFYLHTAFVFATIIEDAKRFPTAAKLAAYCGLSPTLNTSGEEEIRASKKGGCGKPLDNDGRTDLKCYCCEAGQTVINNCKGTKLGKWGWRRINQGKPKNKIVCAVGHKLALYAWHILRGDPTPNREGEALFKRKMVRLYSELGKETMNELGYESRVIFADTIAEKLYSHLDK